MRRLRRALIAPAVCLAFAGAAAAQSGSTTPQERHAVVLQRGTLHTGADATAPIALRIAPGQVFRYLGETTDAFGRAWSVLGDPNAWVRQERWYALAATTREIMALDGADLLTSLPAPRRRPPSRLVGEVVPQDVLAAGREQIVVPADWWRHTERQTIFETEVAELLGAEAYRVGPELVSEAIELLGGHEVLGPWPEEAGFGHLHISPLLPVVWRFDGSSWRLLQGGLTTSPALGILGNPLLRGDPKLPRMLTGSLVPCWTLVGGVDVGGRAAGVVDAAAAAPARTPRAARREGLALLGLTDFGARAWPVATEIMVAPRRMVASTPVDGAMLQDNSARQAVYLEQTVPSEITRRLRGRQLRLQVLARVPQEGETASTGTVAIELAAGAESVSLSAPVGVLPTPLSVSLVVPDDAEEIRVRLIPLDRSIAVAERGRAIFDRASLAPVEWPDHLEPAPLLLRRVRIVTYEPARRYTRAPLAVGERQPEQLSRTWDTLAGGAWDEDQTRRILAGELRSGMPRDEVLLAWGEPRDRTDLGAAQRWDWDDRSAGFDAAGGLITWTRTAENPPPELRRCLVPDPQ